MSRTRSPFRLLLAGALVAALSCADTSPVAPEMPAPEPGLLGTLLRPTGLLQCQPLPTATASAVIGPAGGTLRVGPHTLTVPPRALSAPVTITATAPSGRVNLVEFTPHGLAFDRPARITMSYANCNLLGILLPKRVAYVDDGLGILEYLLSLDNLLAQQVTGRLNHFSGYAVAW
jgi:hypothetical protein